MQHLSFLLLSSCWLLSACVSEALIGDDDSVGDDDDSVSDDDDPVGDDDDDSAGDSPPLGDDDDSSVAPCDELIDPSCGEPPPVPIVGSGDYALWYWPGNHRPVETWPTVEPVMHFLTGHYGMAFDESAGSLLHFGVLTDGLSAQQAQHRPNEDVDNLPSASIRFEAGSSQTPIVATSFEGNSPSAVDRARMIDGGRLMNRIEIPRVSYADDPSLAGSIEIASMPRHVVFSHTVAGSQAAASGRVVLSGAAVHDLPVLNWLVDNRALTLTDSAGQGWLFVVYDTPGATTTLSWDASEGLIAEATAQGAAANAVTVSLLAAPTAALNAAERALYLDPEAAVQVTYTLLDQAGADVGTSLDVPWEPALGAFLLPLGSLQDAGAPPGATWQDPSFHHWYGRHRIEIEPNQTGPISVPLAMHGSGRISWYVVGGAPMLRAANGEPTGIPVQISKNWHESPHWYHLYAQPTFRAGGSEELELTVASSKWGSAYAASHAQLSLIGWNDAGGHWDESALGAFGESITYDPDVTLGRAMVDDVRPFLVQSDQLWGWTGNVGGADFLRYTTAAEPYWQRRLARVRSRYEAVGPNRTEVWYSGLSSDGRIQADIRVQMGATDDLVRVAYDLHYTFLDDVLYDRLAFFQVAADRYADNGFARYAAGNASGVLFDEEITDHGTRGYASEDDRGLTLEGDKPWVMLYDNQRDWDSLPEHYADVGFVVRAFSADIGGTLITTPHLNLQRTLNGGMSQVAFELGLPHEAGSPWCGAPCGGETRMVPAGSEVTATLEYLVPPADKDRYYGSAAYLLALPASAYRSTEMMLELASEGTPEVEVDLGILLQDWPVEILASPGPVAAQLTLTGGRGFTPVIFRGLSRPDGWRLEVQGPNGWSKVDPSVWGNDFWQADYEADTSTWALTFSVANQGTTHYRLGWSGSPQR